MFHGCVYCWAGSEIVSHDVEPRVTCSRWTGENTLHSPALLATGIYKKDWYHISGKTIQE